MYGGRIEAGICILWWVVKLGRQVYCWMIVIMLIYTHSFMYQIIIYMVLIVYNDEYANIYQKQLHEQILNTCIFRYMYVHCSVYILYTCLCACAFRRPFAHIIIIRVLPTLYSASGSSQEGSIHIHTHTLTQRIISIWHDWPYLEFMFCAQYTHETVLSE